VALKTIAENADDAMAAAAYKMFCREAAILQDCKSECVPAGATKRLHLR
jgi:hypothetical protein